MGIIESISKSEIEGINWMVFKSFEQTKFISQIEINKFLDYEINLFFRAFSNSQVHKLENNFFYLFKI